MTRVYGMPKQRAGIKSVTKDQRRKVLTMLLAGASRTSVTMELGWTAKKLSEVSKELCASNIDISSIDDVNARVRDCVTCAEPFASHHRGHRMCNYCKYEAEQV
jgi:hypothetical protein